MLRRSFFLFSVYFCFYDLCFWSQIKKKSLPRLTSVSFYLFSSRSFTVSGLKFKSLIQFELIFVCSISLWFSFFFFFWLSSFSSTIYWKDCPFSIVYSWLFSWKLIGHICMCLFLDLLFWSLDLCICFYAHPTTFWSLCYCYYSSGYLQLCSFFSR